MHIVLVYRYYNDGIVYYNLTFCTRKSLMTDLGLYETTVLYGLKALYCTTPCEVIQSFQPFFVRRRVWLPCHTHAASIPLLQTFSHRIHGTHRNTC